MEEGAADGPFCIITARPSGGKGAAMIHAELPRMQEEGQAHAFRKSRWKRENVQAKGLENRYEIDGSQVS